MNTLADETRLDQAPYGCAKAVEAGDRVRRREHRVAEVGRVADVHDEAVVENEDREEHQPMAHVLPKHLETHVVQDAELLPRRDERAKEGLRVEHNPKGKRHEQARELLRGLVERGDVPPRLVRIALRGRAEVDELKHHTEGAHPPEKTCEHLVRAAPPEEQQNVRPTPRAEARGGLLGRGPLRQPPGDCRAHIFLEHRHDARERCIGQVARHQPETLAAVGGACVSVVRIVQHHSRIGLH